MKPEELKVIVGSTNPVKITATKKAFSKVWPEIQWHTEGINVDSGVSNQPMSDKEAITGATNRALKVLKAYSPDFAVGLEGGLQQVGDYWFTCGWVVVLKKDGTKGIGASAKIITPTSMIKKILNGEELGNVVDQKFNTSNAKQDQGHMGLLTAGIISRTKAYTDGIIMALARFITPQLF